MEEVPRGRFGYLVRAIAAAGLRRVLAITEALGVNRTVVGAKQMTRKAGQDVQWLTVQASNGALYAGSAVLVFACVTALSCAFGAAVCLLVWWIWAPRNTDLEYAFMFDYTTDTPQAELLLGPAHAGGRSGVPDYPMAPWDTFNFTLQLTVPETRRNFAIGMFTAAVVVRAAADSLAAGAMDSTCPDVGAKAVSGDVLGHMKASSMLRTAEQCQDTYWYRIFGSCEWRLSPGPADGVQHLALPLEARWHPLHGEKVSSFEISLSKPLQLYASRLTVSAQLSGFSGYMQRAPLVVLLSVFVVAAGCCGTSVSVVLGLVLFLWWRTRRRHSEHDETDSVSDDWPPRAFGAASPRFGAAPAALPPAMLVLPPTRAALRTRTCPGGSRGAARPSLAHGAGSRPPVLPGSRRVAPSCTARNPPPPPLVREVGGRPRSWSETSSPVPRPFGTPQSSGTSADSFRSAKCHQAPGSDAPPAAAAGPDDVFFTAGMRACSA
eukprot:TRINITY_DN16466_c0_g1_i1.p1 TRINITY_DN16466_c0_g1~~TRINITY_DN16466_c0_g1_i1.p1  ORF type:complete len:492 (+),score=68.01 TRINITY_DN16466_c0_g1_i1:80-1555(+)